MNSSKANEFDRYLPVANIGRIIKNNLPKEVKLSKEAKETFQECLSEFISFITSEASDRCLIDKRKTINGEDLIHSLSALGFDHYKNILKVYLEKYRESQKISPYANNLNNNENNKDSEKIKDLNINKEKEKNSNNENNNMDEIDNDYDNEEDEDIVSNCYDEER
jgi:histone H3/H4